MLGSTNSVKAFSEALNASMNILFNKGLGQAQDEYQADADATWLLVQAGYDPQALVRYLEKIAQRTNQLKVLEHTHPPISDRLAQLKKLIQENGLDQLNYPKMEKRYHENLSS